jgi:hypothetical protein
MQESLDDRARTESDEATKRAPSEESLSGEPVAISPGEDRHAVVCTNAVKHLPDLRAFAGALASSRHHADDLVQIAILRVPDSAQQFTPGTNFKARIFTILRNNRLQPAALTGLEPGQLRRLCSRDGGEAGQKPGILRLPPSLCSTHARAREALLPVGASGLAMRRWQRSAAARPER